MIHGVGKYEWPDGRVWYSKYCSLILEVGLKIKCTAEGNIYGKMESVMMESINMIKNVVLVYSIGPMENNSKVNG